MAKLEDLTGKRFGMLTVVSRAEDYRSPSGRRVTRWLCRCDCGTEKVMLRNTLKQARSCGCMREKSNQKRIRDLTGLRFGRWLAVARAPLPGSNSSRVKNGWLCRCDCGTERVIPAQQLLTGRSTSCGCRRVERIRRATEAAGENTLGRYDGTVVSQLTRKKLNCNNQSGVRGVYWSERERQYVAKIGVRGKSITIGRFNTLQEAAKARESAEQQYFLPILHAYYQKKEKDGQP